MNRFRHIVPGPVLFIAIWLLFMVGGRSRLFRDPGTFWHTAVGDRILTVGFFDTDPYSFTRAGEPWIPHQWLGEVGLALTHRVAGFDSLLLLTAAGLAVLYTWLTLRLLRTGVHPVLALSVAVLGLAAGATHFHVRPHLATIAGMAVTAAVLADFDAGLISVRRFWLLVPVYAIWANVHGGMLGGLVTLGLAGTGWVGAWAVGWPTPLRNWRRVFEYVAVATACGLTAFVTPYGIGVSRAWLTILSLGDLSRYVEEHAPLSVSDPGAWPVLALASVYLFVLAGIRGRPRVAWLLPLFWLFQAYSRVRHASLFGVVALVAVADIWPHSAWAKRMSARRPDLYEPGRLPPRSPFVAWLVPIALVALTAGLQATGVRVPVVGAGWARLDPDRWPVGILGAVREHEPRGESTITVFNECEFGGFLIYHTPGYRVFFDDRFELYGGDAVREFVQAGSEQTAGMIESWQARYGRFGAALIRTGGGFDAYFRDHPDEWAVAASDKTATFYVRRE